jgi:hypothetical protein
MATARPTDDEIQLTTHTNETSDDADTRTQAHNTHLRELLIRITGDIIGKIGGSLEGSEVIGIGYEEGRSQMEICYRNITDLGTLILNPLTKHLTETDLRELHAAASVYNEEFQELAEHERTGRPTQHQMGTPKHSMFLILRLILTNIGGRILRLVQGKEGGDSNHPGATAEIANPQPNTT